MCEFCLKHGEGSKWYLEARNYSEDLLNDIRRLKYIEGFFTKTSAIKRNSNRLDKLDSYPVILKRIISSCITRKMKRDHFGQVIPIEDIEKILGFVNSIIRVDCLCRTLTIKKKGRYCYGLSLGPNGGKLAEIFRGLDRSFLNGPDSLGLENLSKEEALTAFRRHEKEGLCHTIWTLNTPFIGGICNCDRTDCLAMHVTISHDMPIMFRAEYIAHVDKDDCVGCRECLKFCQFGALSFSVADKKVLADKRWCYGCGICRGACKKDAIKLLERKDNFISSKYW